MEPVPGKSGVDGAPSRAGGGRKDVETEELGVRRKLKVFLLPPL